MSSDFLAQIQKQLADIEAGGFYKHERLISSEQFSEVTVDAINKGGSLINLCANNYLGLANSPKLVEAAKAAMDVYGYGLASVRFICGTQMIHRQLEQTISRFLGFEDTILYSSCFDANGGVFETLLGSEDAVISDALNHASIIDGVRLCKARRYRYANNDMADLKAQLVQANMDGARFKLIVTDGVFSMDGVIANLHAVCNLAQQLDALVMVDDSHATGFMGKHGRGTLEYCGVEGRVDIVSGTLGKALGGASGGYIAASQPVVDLLRQRSRPYLFSNTLAPAIVGGSIKAFALVEQGDALRLRLFDNARYFRQSLEKAGFHLLPGEHPIIPVMLGDARLAQEMSTRLLHEGVYVIGFSYPVVPEGKARIRTQMSAAHTREQLDQAIEAFIKVGRTLEVIH